MKIELKNVERNVSAGTVAPGTCFRGKFERPEYMKYTKNTVYMMANCGGMEFRIIDLLTGLGCDIKGSNGYSHKQIENFETVNLVSKEE